MTEKALRDIFVSTAISYLGSDEGGSKHKYIVDTYNKIVPLPSNYKMKYTDAWCAAFVSAIASICGFLDIIPAECSCGRQIKLWQNMKRWQENDSYVPNVGDVIYYDWDDNGVGDAKGNSDHVGIVASVDNKQIKVIEGNISDTVGYRTISINGKYIRGYGLPNFASKADSGQKLNTCDITLAILSNGSKGSNVKALQILLEGYGFDCGKSGADGKFGSDTLKAVKQYQKTNKLDIDGVVGPKTWQSLLGMA